MSRTFHHGERRIRVRGVRRGDPDLRKLARALIDLAQAEAEAEAKRQHEGEGESGRFVSFPREGSRHRHTRTPRE